MADFIDITGRKFGLLSVIKRSKNLKTGQATWLCRCDCGTVMVVSGQALRTGNTTSCGCKRKQNKVPRAYTGGKRVNENWKIEAKMNRESIVKMRNRVLELDKICKNPSEIASRIRPEFSQLAEATVKDYVYITHGATEAAFNAYLDGKIGFAHLMEIARWHKASDESKNFLAEEIISEKLSVSQVRKIKNYVKKGASMYEAIKKAKGEIPIASKPASKKSAKSLDDLLNDILKLATTFRVKVDMARDLLPLTTLDGGKVHTAVFEKVYLLRHILKEQYEFVDVKVRQYIEEITGALSQTENGDDIEDREILQIGPIESEITNA